jgi:hypothetical protein
VTNEEFNIALANKINQKIIKAVTHKYSKIIPPSDLEICGQHALWRCLGYHRDDKGKKFTTSLWTFTEWECNRELRKINRYKQKKTINISAIETKEKFDSPCKDVDPEVLHLRECISILPSHRWLMRNLQ